MPLDRLSDRIQQFLVAERLGKKFESTRFHRAHRGRNVAVPGDEDDRNVELEPGHAHLQVETGQAGQSNVEHEAAGNVRGRPCEEFLRGGKRLGL